MPDELVWCDYELARFPADQFVWTEENGRVHQPNGPAGPSHTATGEPIGQTHEMHAMTAEETNDSDA